MANHMSREQMQQQCENAKRLGFRPDRLMLLDERLTAWSQTEETPSIVVRVLRHGETAFEGAYGILGPDKAPDFLMTDAIFPVCSITKPIVSTLLTIMQEEGLVDLNQPVRYYLPEFTGDADSKIRIWHLLTHTSGIIEADLEKFCADYAAKLGLTIPKDEDSEEIWDEFCLAARKKIGLPELPPGRAMRQDTFKAVRYIAPPTYKPMEIMQYCSTGFEIAMDIVKRISGRKIDDYATEKLFGPLNMTDTHFLFPREKLPRFVTRAQKYVGSNWLNADVLNSESGGGGMKSTTADMTRFGQMFLNGGTFDGVRILSPASIREMTANHIADLPMNEYDGEVFDSSWGLGWNVRSTKKDDAGVLRSPHSFEHAGFGCTRLLCDRDADVVSAFFTVCITDTYQHLNQFNNMVFGAIDDVYC